MISTVRLEDVLELVAMGPFGSDLKVENFTESGVPVIRGGNLGSFYVSNDGLAFVSEEKAETLARSLALPGDLVITHRGTLGQISMVPREGIFDRYLVSQSQMLVRPDTLKAHPEYLTYWLRSPAGQGALMAYSVQTGVPALAQPTKSIKSLQIPLPPLAVQKAVGEVLGALDDKIAANRKISDSSNALIALQVAARLQIATPLSKAPIHFIFGEAFSGAQFSEPGQGRPLIRIRDLKSQQCQVWTTEQRPRETAVSPGDLLIGMDAEFRATRWSGPPGVLNQRVMMAESDELGHPITQIALRETLARIERSKSGTTVIHLNKSDLDREFVMLPAADDLKELRGIVDPLWARATLAEVESRTLTAVRDELLPQLMSGRITVKDAEKRVEEEV